MQYQIFLEVVSSTLAAAALSLKKNNSRTPNACVRDLCLFVTSKNVFIQLSTENCQVLKAGIC